MTPLRIGSRGSQLALFQSRLAAERIREAGGPPCEIVIIKTTGDRFTDRPLSEIGGKRLFVREIEDALLSGDVDLAVHSSKDMPAELPDGLVVAAVLPREDPRDVIVLPETLSVKRDTGGFVEKPASMGAVFTAFNRNVVVGTGSVRRIAQLRRIHPQATFKDIRGNLDTRLRKLDNAEYDAIVLAAAGLRRLGFSSRISQLIEITECIPAPGQGIIALETRADDQNARDAVSRVNDLDAFTALEAERALVAALGGGCQMPIGGIATVSGSSMELDAIVASLDGGRAIRYKQVGAATDAAGLGRAVAAALLREGASDILRESTGADSVPRSLT